MKGKKAKKPPKPNRLSIPSAQEGHAGATIAISILDEPVAIPSFICLLTKKILNEMTIPPRIEIMNKEIRDETEKLVKVPIIKKYNNLKEKSAFNTEKFLKMGLSEKREKLLNKLKTM